MAEHAAQSGRGREVALRGVLSLAACLASSPVLSGEIDALLFGSLDAGAANFLTVGAKLSLGPLDQTGFVALASVGGGRRNETVCGCTSEAGPLRLSRYTALGAALLGHQWVSEWGVVAVYAGPEGSVEALTDGSGVAFLPARGGLRLHGEVWARPTRETLVQATAILGSARESAWTRIGLGYRIWDTYLGPEASLYADRTGYTKWNLGFHATDFAIWRYSFRLSAGVQIEAGERPSPYVALSVWTPW